MPAIPPKRPSIKDMGLATYFQQIGLDYSLWCQMVDSGVAPASLRRFFRKPNNTLYSRPTIEKWKLIYLKSKQHG